jgi:Chaperone of endosialidase
MGGKTSTTTQQVSIPKEVMDRYNAVNTRAETVAQNPFQIYSMDPSKFVAQINPQQQQGIGAVNQAAGSYAPYFEKAYGSATAGMASAQPQALNLDQFYNPFQQQVIDATMRQMTQANEQAQSGALGTAVSSGAFGGDRAGIAAANLANQQGLAMGSTLAGLNAQNYQQALGAAQQQQGVQLGATQADLARLLQGGQFYAGLGQAAQQAGLQGAEAQINAGTLGQQTEQAGLTSLYNQFMQQQAYPFQVAQFLANIGMGTGALSGSTTTAVQPGSFFSDRRLKEDVERVGHTDDGMPIYKYRYKGEPETHIGLMADEVEKVKPEAVGLHPTGYKTVDYDRATKAEGGGVAGPYGFGVGSQPGEMSYVPQAYLPVGELMVADPSMLANARQSFAQQLEAAARFGESVRGLDETWNWARDKWGSDEREGAVASGERAAGTDVRNSRGGVVGYANGGSAEYLKGGLKPEQPVSKETYLSDILKGQSESGRRELPTGGSMPAARTTGQDVVDLGNLALAFMGLGMNTGGRVGYQRGGRPEEEGTSGEGIADYFAPLRYAVTNRLPNAAASIGSMGLAGVQGATGLAAGALNYPETSQEMLDAARNSVYRSMYFDQAANAPMPQKLSREEIRELGPSQKQELARSLTEEYSRDNPRGMTMVPQRFAGDDRDNSLLALVPAEGLVPDTEYGRLLRDPSSALPPIGFRRGLVPAAGTPLPPSPVLAQAAGTPFPSTPTGLGARLMENDPQMGERGDLRFLLSSPDLQGGEYPTGLSMRRPMPRPVSISTSGAPEATGVVAPAGAPAAPAPAPEATGVVTPVVTGGGEGGWDLYAPAIKARESGGDYDALYAFSNREGGPFAGVKVTDMTVDDAINFSAPDSAYANWSREKLGYMATPMGAYQIVGSTLRGIKEGMGLTGTERMTPELQEQMAKWLYDNYGTDPWRASEGMVQTADGLVPSGVRYQGDIKGAPAERRGLIAGLSNDVPYDERNVLGRMMYDPETNELSRNALLSLASGVGSMLASPSQFFLPSLGLGLQGFAGTYAGLEKQAADIAYTKAQEQQSRMATDAARFTQLDNGRVLVNFGDGRPAVTLQEYFRNPQAYSTGDVARDREIMEAARAAAAANGISVGAAPSGVSGVRFTDASQDIINQQNQYVSSDVGFGMYGPNVQAAAAAVQEASSLGASAMNGKASSNELAKTVANSVAAGDFGSVQGRRTVLENILQPLNAVLTSAGIEAITPINGTITNQQIFDKLGILRAGEMTPEQDRAASVFERFVETNPTLEMTKEAAAEIAAALQMSHQMDIDRAQYFNHMQSRLPAGYAPYALSEGFNREYAGILQAEKSQLSTLYQMADDPTPVNGGRTRGELVTQFMKDVNAGLLDQATAQEILAGLLAQKDVNASPILARWFIRGM